MQNFLQYVYNAVAIMMVMILSSCDTRPVFNFKIFSKLNEGLKVTFIHESDGVKTLTIPSYDSNWSKQNGFLISGRGSFRSITVKSNNRILYSASPIEIEDWFAIQGGDGNFFYLYRTFAKY
jgi:hypothetical protein